MMISLQNGVSRAPLVSDRAGEAGYAAVKQEPASSLSLVSSFKGPDSHEDEDMHMALAHQMYKSGSYKQALEHSNSVYERNPLRTDNLLLLGAIYYQLHDYDMCIARNEEALRLEPRFAECYGNMANAWKEKGDIDLAIRYYLVAIELRPNFADAWSNLASAYMRKGRLNEAAQCCRQALALNPLLVDAHSNLGNLMKAQGLVQEAYSCYLEALRIQPTFAIAWSNLAGLFMESGDLNRALQYYKEAVKLKPTFPDAYLNLGNVYKALGMPQEAIVCYQRAVQTRPNAIAFGNLASTYYERGQADMAILYYKQAIGCDPRFLEAYNNLGNALKDVGRVDEAIQCYNQCLSLQPSHPQALTNLGNIYMEWNMLPAAASYYKATLAVTTGLSAPFNNLAVIYKQQGNYADAISCYNEVLRIDPLAADGLVNRGNTYKEIGRVTDAIQDYIRAITIRPTMAEAHANLASAYKDSGHVEAAIKSYKQALLLRPDFPEATCNLLHTLQCVCSWEDRDRMFSEVEGIIRRQVNMSVLPSVQPFHAIAYPIDPMLALEISRKYASHCSIIASRFALPSFNHPAPIPIRHDGGLRRLRVGYVSSDFGNHPLSHLMGSVFGMHNKENVEVFCYALSPNDGTEWRQRTQSEAEHFVDVSTMSSDMIAKLINEDKIQILINLNGYTKGARNEIFAMRPAPIQVSYMGFPGTTGASYIDYLVTDEFVSPLRYAHIYSEKLVHVPHCYFVNDYKQKNMDVLDPNCQPKRSDYGLPEDKFIFACFNQLYKMDPEIFNTWCNILRRVPNSALWLLRFPAAGEMRLRAYAVAQGVQPDQIIFTDVAMKQEHIRRSSLADLFLDTPLCNAHTTGTDILWAGLPMITLPLEKMATRVAGSLCLATGLGEEMIVNSMKEYEERAVSLALDRQKLQALTNKLKSMRLTCPLFDTARWVKNLERSYFKMWSLHCSGQKPQHFKVTENDLDFPCDR
ncbi:putative UDP-N-acetylglucosamine--peptide N-acetylglucosaminyltransferase SEC [Citrus sinensis]|uniref:probable UDP-N-acetylglucosamine--peptide N-acetylglucosaminyltransferase SEC n=1 Tax=Citrus sinensis TaxID=2711 RepID=UPI00219BA342|nr:probable UDP-N-acetylglucosamine--peptide N-acetylglucosaminyltransferase SEC [Citrus sinensis]XP_052292251.1 probable UDP-N-acetylglucosamine--peptide N-acetylglucosaminyltransferase SEC [Citrus sinensis]KAH9728206.1 putative UDP-N-acetylglucosamine--peptide N-acetylglucosaminyltransferase SEC [Citrus sinensis]